MKRNQVIINCFGNTRTRSMFNSQGQLNAASLQQALQALMKYAAILEFEEKK